jgi:hypothetical protein
MKNNISKLPKKIMFLKKRIGISTLIIMNLLFLLACSTESILSPQSISEIVNIQLQTPTIKSTISSIPLSTLTFTKTLKPTKTFTQTFDPVIPDIMIQGAHLTGMDPEELWSVYLTIHNALRDNDPLPFAKLGRYPLSVCRNYEGTVASETEITTMDEFIELYPYQMIEKYRSYLFELRPEDLLYTGGLGFGTGQIWITKLDKTIYMTSFMDYCYPLEFSLSNFQNNLEPRI